MAVMRRAPKPKKKKKPKRPAPKPKPKTLPPAPSVGNPGGVNVPASDTGSGTGTGGTTTTTSTTGLPSSAAGQLAQDAGQLEAESQAAQDYESAQPMVTTPSTTAPANAGQDAAAQAAATALQSFYGSGSADAPQYAPSSNVYAAQVAASSGAENNPT